MCSTTIVFISVIIIIFFVIVLWLIIIVVIVIIIVFFWGGGLGKGRFWRHHQKRQRGSEGKGILGQLQRAHVGRRVEGKVGVRGGV